MASAVLATNTRVKPMATNKTAPAPVAPKAQAPAPAPVAHVPPLNAKGQPMAVLATAPAPAPVVVATGATLYTWQAYNGATNTGWPVGQRGHRAFACQVAQALAKAHPAGFTLAQYRAALVASAAASPTLPTPNGGWARHNMPQWAAAQKWLVPTGGHATA